MNNSSRNITRNDRNEAAAVVCCACAPGVLCVYIDTPEDAVVVMHTVKPGRACSVHQLI
jgi:hypothetical protein